MDVVCERAFAVDLDDRKPLPVARLELGVAADVDLDELERPLGPHVVEHHPCPLAEVAARRGVERDARYG
jgi:hypothetical protein